MRTRLNLVIAQSQGQEVLDWSFEQYLQWLSTTRLDFTNPHFGTQKFWGEGLIFKFDHVIKVESVGENIPLGQGKYLRVPPETRASKHHNPRQNLEGYFGDLPYSGLRNEYGTFPAWENFYNDATKALVVDLFGIDFSAYSYPTEIA